MGMIDSLLARVGLQRAVATPKFTDVPVPESPTYEQNAQAPPKWAAVRRKKTRCVPCIGSCRWTMTCAPPFWIFAVWTGRTDG
ncbi:hypothetical protein [Paludibacterium denitrificans]|uniref:Uncharacterized protein n=1 Tax=Paludibacterium denitrificans TaxID=2675226 RepID=A0A844GAS8_9NEIS|nr:hypothetical protein [Paludibacterium denitrificans]MTD32391.1 hypothetical protein [Paludibacterium denitrificans]